MVRMGERASEKEKKFRRDSQKVFINRIVQFVVCRECNLEQRLNYTKSDEWLNGIRI